MIYYTTPYGSSVGEYLNDICSNLNDDDWVCSRDGDTMMFGNFGKRIELLTKSGFDLIGCKTNRLNIKLCSHLIETEMYHEKNVLEHAYHAEELWQRHHDKVLPTNYVIAGNFMLFKVGLAKQIGFDNTIRFDINFSNKVKNKGIAHGMYVFHFYRFNKNTLDISHLW